MHGFLELTALIVFVTAGTGLLLAGAVALVLSADRRAPDRPGVADASVSADQGGAGASGGRAHEGRVDGRERLRAEREVHT